MIYQSTRYLHEKYDVITFEVWNEPDANWFWNGTREELIEMYDHTARAIKRAAPDALVGGPTNAHLVPHADWVEDLVKHCAENDVPLDVICWHDYLHYSRINNRVHTYIEQAELVREIVERYPQVGNPRLAITEWGYDWNNARRQWNDSTFHGAFIAQSLFEMQEEDFLFAAFCSHTRSHSNPNPAWQSLKMFSMLSDRRISGTVTEDSTSVEVLASRNGDRITIMVWDFPFRMPELENKVKPVKVSLKNLPSGEYGYIRYLVDEEHSGNPLVKVYEQQMRIRNKAELAIEMHPYAVSLIVLEIQ